MTKAQDNARAWFKELKGLDKQDLNTVASVGMGIGMGITGYYMGRVTALDGKALAQSGTVFGGKNPLKQFGGFNPSKALPVLSILNKAHDTLDRLRTLNKPTFEQYKTTLETLRQMDEKLSEANDAAKDMLRRAMKPFQDLAAKQERLLAEFFELQKGLFIGQAILGAFITMWLGNNPDVVKQMISSGEKVAVRGIDELSELIDKSGEAIKDAAEGLLPDLWGLGW